MSSIGGTTTSRKIGILNIRKIEKEGLVDKKILKIND